MVQVKGRIDTVVAGVLITITFLYLSSVFNVIIPWLSYSVPGATNLLILTTTTGLGLLCYVLCVFVDPGSPPTGYEPDAEQIAVAMQVKRGGGKRFCKKCNAHKPPRTHHCRRCGRCILRFDHHCVWINGCVGHGNYRAFLCMCMYLTMAAVHALGLFLALDARLIQAALGLDEESRAIAALGDGLESSISSSNSAVLAGNSTGVEAEVERAVLQGRSLVARRVGWNEFIWFHAFIQIVSTAVALPLVVGLGMLLFWNFYLFFSNRTTIEYHEGVRVAGTAGAAALQPKHHHHRGGNAHNAQQHPFDLGWHHNMHAVCGDDVLSWWVPIKAGAAGNGTHFSTIYDAVRDG